MAVSVADPSCCKPASECALQFWSAPTPISELQLSGCYGTKCPITKCKTNQCHTRVSDSDVAIAGAKEEI